MAFKAFSSIKREPLVVKCEKSEKRIGDQKR
jgi:hypothetical protein